MAPTPGGPGPAAGAASLSLQPGPPQQPVVVGGPPGALPGAARGHAAARRAPGRAWARSHGPHRPLRPARRASSRSPACRCGRRRGPPRPRLPHKVAQTPPPPPALPGAAGPAAGAGDREAGLARARKVSAGEIPAWSRPGQAGRSARDPRQVPRTATALPPAPESPSSGRTRRPTPPAGIDSAHPRVGAPWHWAGRKATRRAPCFRTGNPRLGSE